MKSSKENPLQLSQFKHVVSYAIGEQIRILRREKGLSGRDFGALIGLSEKQISRYERGNNCMTVELLLLMLSYLEISPEAFFHYLTLRLKKEGLSLLSSYSFYDNGVHG